ncbi:Phosphotransferase, choline kinase family enzyme [Fictibacillus macauensis ZFHKF-1]|uniref:Phosphotransferase, choline kinase family enzyme n=1 Tax=Fictibacillus macauensis ZFHKF-1 TaxID=1196324 RepID=I8AIG9_9BACL|nr:phosphotransferase family protein [Fictibacillus macauensis]EIT85507.1 Phosphotransferase, choline kinase family enzyme [Fictibacillus macauensis ZFHKF-1]
MEHLLGNGWEIKPAGGATGEAYQAKYEDQTLFLKRNSSPFLAVLSAEGIVPKLLWTKRLGNGDVITAQKWLNGRELKATEMNREEVGKLLQRIHTSTELKAMLQRLGKQPLTPASIADELERKALELQPVPPVILESLAYIKEEMAAISSNHEVVCHCDVNHNNWLMSDRGELFLIDWDGAMIADPALDLGMLLYWYIDKDHWESWLATYGVALTQDLQRRMHWYVVAQTIISIFWHHERKQFAEKEYWCQFLKKIQS